MDSELKNGQESTKLTKNVADEAVTSSNASTDMAASKFEAEVIANAPSMRGRRLNWAIAFVAGTGFTLFGYVS